jgi:SagB-type dehydrogenase family enzyme
VKIVVVVAPALLVALVLIGLALGGRPVSRRGLNVIAAIVLFAYVTATSALGVFWVSRMDLPAFDWHYLAGYSVMVLVLVHVVLQLRGLLAWVRTKLPRSALTADRRRLRRSLRVALYALLGLVGSVPLAAWLIGAQRSGRDRIAPASSIAVAEPDRASAEREEVWIERDGERIGAVDYLWQQSSYTRRGLIRSPGIAPPKPRELRDYPGQRWLSLPAPAAQSGVTLRAQSSPKGGRDRIVLGRTAPNGPASVELLSSLLHYSYGVTGRHAEGSGFLFRAAASSGALYPIDLFVLAPGVGTLGNAIHYYDPHRHALTAVTAGDAGELERGLPPDSTARSASLLLVLGATFDRTRVKYGTRSYRYVGLDAGHLAENTLRAGSALGLHCRLEPLFDDQALARAVGLTDDGEGVVLVIACDTGGAGRSPRPARARNQTVAHSLVELPEHADEVELTRLSHRLTSFRLTAAGPVRRAPPAAKPAATGGTLELTASPPPELDLFEVIARRRSVRDYASSPLALHDLAAILERAHAAGGALGRERLIDLYVFARRVEGVAAGVYLYDEQRGTLVSIRAGSVSAKLESAGLGQELLGNAGAVIAFSLKQEVPGRIDGARDFRHALLEAGLGGESIYLDATARGYGACDVGAFYDDEIAELAERAGEKPRVVLLTALGALR